MANLDQLYTLVTIIECCATAYLKLSEDINFGIQRMLVSHFLTEAASLVIFLRMVSFLGTSDGLLLTRDMLSRMRGFSAGQQMVRKIWSCTLCDNKYDMWLRLYESGKAESVDLL